MTPEEQDKPVRDLIAEVYLPPDLCPSTPEAIEAMLDAAAGPPLTDEQVERMLKKAKGELPVGERRDQEDEAIWPEQGLTEQGQELVALYRNSGGELPPEIKEKLRQLREKANDQPDEGEDFDDELEP